MASMENKYKCLMIFKARTLNWFFLTRLRNLGTYRQRTANAFRTNTIVVVIYIYNYSSLNYYLSIKILFIAYNFKYFFLIDFPE